MKTKEEIKHKIDLTNDMIKNFAYKKDLPVLKKELAGLHQQLDVFAYFSEIFGEMPSDDTLMDLPVNSPCGADCKKVIDAGKRLADLSADIRQDLIQLIDSQVETFWRG
jgi:hypothetical protein